MRRTVVFPLILALAVSLIGGTLWYVFTGDDQVSVPRGLPELHGSSSGAPGFRALDTPATPEVHTVNTALFASSTLQQVVSANIIREHNTKGTSLGVFAGNYIGMGKYIQGREPGILGGSRGVQSAAAISDEELIDYNLITDKIRLLAEAVPLLETDVTSLLDRAPDRFEALTGLIRALEDSRTQLRVGLIDLEAELRTLQNDLNALRRLKEGADDTFFRSARQLLSQETYDALDSAITLKQSIAKLEAQIAALSTIHKYFDTVEERTDLAYTTLRANQEALIKGVQVVEVEDMRLNLILSERDWRAITGITD